MQKWVKDRQYGWDRSKAALLKIRDLCKKRGVPFLLLDNCHPPIAELPEFCTLEGIPYFDAKFTNEERAMPIYNSLLDSHSNALGNQIFLDKVKAALREAGLFDLK